MHFVQLSAAAQRLTHELPSSWCHTEDILKSISLCPRNGEYSVHFKDMFTHCGRDLVMASDAVDLDQQWLRSLNVFQSYLRPISQEAIVIINLPSNLLGIKSLKFMATSSRSQLVSKNGNTKECHYKAVHHNKILHISLQKLRQNMKQMLNPQNISHTSRFGVFFCE